MAKSKILAAFAERERTADCAVRHVRQHVEQKLWLPSGDEVKKPMPIKTLLTLAGIALTLEVIAPTGVYERYPVFQEFAVVIAVACCVIALGFLTITFGDYE